MTEPSAKVIADSISPRGHRVTTIEAVIHRYVLAEFNTHRVFSRNSASSRAIPTTKQLDRVLKDPAFPVSWPHEQRGMQGGEELPTEAVAFCRSGWATARDKAVAQVSNLLQVGLHKSVVNRLLEPFMWHTVVVTSTAWENFFGLRCNPMAQPEIRVAAEAMKAAYDASTPQPIDYGMWHLPYIEPEDIRAAEEYIHADGFGKVSKAVVTETLVQMSSARCARVSYLTQNGDRSVLDDVSLYNRLTMARPMHASPLEHPCTPTDEVRQIAVCSQLGKPVSVKELVLPKYGNLLGWHQHRFDVEVAADYQAFA